MSEYQFATDDDLDLSSPPRTRRLVAALVVGLHVVAVLGLIQAFAPDFTAKVADSVMSSFSVTITTPPPPQPPPAKAPDKSGEAAEIGKKAEPRPIAAPQPKIAIATQSAPPVAGSGAQNAAGSAQSGQGTGAGGQGNGMGAGNGGDGRGGGPATKPVRIAGDINSARDFPKETREARIGSSVVIALTVGTDGRVKRCIIHRPSADPQSDAITCRLAMERFRFRPATDSSGNAVESVYGWQQRWFRPGENN